MKIRAITAGFNVAMPSVARRIERIGKFMALAKSAFEDTGYEVQTTRITSQPWAEYVSGGKEHEVCEKVGILENCCRMNGIDFCSIGTAYMPENIELIAGILASTEIVSCSATAATSRGGIDHSAISAASRTVLRIAEKTANGVGNFRFAVIANCPPDIPFFPASYHRGRACFMIALEASDLLVEAFSSAHDFASARKNLEVILEREYKKVENVATRIEKQGRVLFRGLDLSPAPSIASDESIVLAFERMGYGAFGGPGTLAVAGMITEVLRSVSVRQCGFSGLMLPVMEDFGLAQRIGDMSVDSLLVYSAVCGTGLDCLPLPCDIPANKIQNLLLDVSMLALRLDKPLMARLLPIPGRHTGEMTNIDSPYLINCTIPQIK